MPPGTMTEMYCTFPIAEAHKNGVSHLAVNVTLDIFMWEVAYMLKSES